MSHLARILLFAILATGCGLVHAEERIDFNQHIRPILSNSCFNCHGPDEKTREADLRLDTRDGAIEDLGGYAAIVPGDPDASLLLDRITATDEDELMPPPATKKPKLTADEVSLIRRWIAQGAEYKGHWAFLPLNNEPPPEVKSPTIRNPIDQYVVAKLEKQGITPSPEADRAVLIRRLSLDLVGLLPTAEEVEAFVADPDPQAYDKLVERLLASPHYGERWGRHWLDQARYADSNGYSSDSARNMWPYRDWVIQALNDDMPFNQFTIEQLAGDLLPKPTKSQLVATAYHRNTLINQEGGTDREQFRVESVMDRTETTGAVWLGLTVGCARCHTHKFDPIAHSEYFQFYAYFNSTKDVNNAGPVVGVAGGEMLDEKARQTGVPTTDLTQVRAAWERETLTRMEKHAEQRGEVVWKPARYVSYEMASKGGFELLDDNSLLADGSAKVNDSYEIVAHADMEKVAAVRIRVLTHPSLPKQGPGMAANGNFVLTDVKVSVADADLPITGAFADHAQPSFPVTAAIDNNRTSGWAINIASGSRGAVMNANHEAVFLLGSGARPEGKPFKVEMFHNLNENYLIGRFAIEFSERTPRMADTKQALLVALKKAPATRDAREAKLVKQSFELAEPTARYMQPAKLAGTVNQMIMGELPKPRPTYLLTRGDFTRPNKELGPLLPGVLAAVEPALPESDKPGNRLDLARWLIDERNPLTPRVTVNRLWMRYFGRGLVETENDFGTQGSFPTHPALLDWLSAEFVRQDWSLKQMHRLVVTSATYRQSSRVRPDVAAKDPRNLLLSRQQRFRLEGEVIRDAALSASGLLNPTIGGPSVHPPQPAGVYSFTQVAKRWNTETGPNRYRRGMYTFFYRSAPYPLFTTFDAPDFQSVCTRRGRSNTPLQSLTLANDEAFVEIARGLAARLVRELPGDALSQLDARIEKCFLLCLSRKPTETEYKLLADYFRRQLTEYNDDEAAASQLAPLSLGRGLPPAEAAALICLARAVLNTDNFITRE